MPAEAYSFESAGDHDVRVAAAAKEAGLQLRPRNVRVFDEVVDIVNFDLVIVADHFDLTEVSTLRPAPTSHSRHHASAAGVCQDSEWTLLPKSCLA